MRRPLNGYLRLGPVNELCPFLCDFWCNHVSDDMRAVPQETAIEHREARRERVRRRWNAKHQK